MPNGDRSREAVEDALAVGLNGEETSLALRPLITFSRMEAFHQIHLGAVGEGNLLVATTNAEHRLLRVPDDFKDTGQ